MNDNNIINSTGMIVSSNDEITTSNDNNKIIANEKIVGLIQNALEMINEDREMSKELFEAITKEFTKFHEITMKSDGAVRALESMGKSTDRLNALLAIIQKFNTDKTNKEIAESIISASDKNTILDFLESAGVGPKRLLEEAHKRSVDDDIHGEKLE